MVDAVNVSVMERAMTNYLFLRFFENGRKGKKGRKHGDVIWNTERNGSIQFRASKGMDKNYNYGQERCKDSNHGGTDGFRWLCPAPLFLFPTSDMGLMTDGTKNIPSYNKNVEDHRLDATSADARAD